MLLKKKLQITAITITAIILLSVIVLLIIYNFFKISYNNNENDEIESQVTITRDIKGIPHIEAESVNDFYFTLGYLHAKDRLNVIEYLRSIATGKSEKYAGDDSNLLNNLCNTIGFTKNAELIAEKLPQNDIIALNNYIKGINHVRKNNHVTNLLSREWKMEDVLAILSMKDWANSYLNNTELIFNLSDTEIDLSKNLFTDNRHLYFYNDDNLQYLYTLRRIKELVEKYICTFARGNSIYISPEYTASGADSFTTLNYDDSMTIYPGWYPVKLTLNGQKTYAVTYNGLPFIMSFKNDAISVTQININADTQNFYLFNTENKNNTPVYSAAGLWKEYISVRVPAYDKDEAGSEIKWTTEKGPVISELISSAKNDSQIMVIESVQPGIEYINLLLRLPFETDVEKVQKIVSSNDSSLKCFIISDNNKAYKIYSGLANPADKDNRIFIEGSKSLKQPPSKISVITQISGLDYSGSDLVKDNDISKKIKNTISNDFKIERFDSLLAKKKIYDNHRIKNIITDNFSVTAQKFVPLFDKIFENLPLTSSKLSRIYFSDWDFTAKPGLQAPSIFYTTLYYFLSESYRDDFGKDSDFNLNSAYLLYPDFLMQCQKRITTIFDRPDTTITESMETVFYTAFLNSMRYLNRKEGPFMENWKWGLINKSSFKTPSEKLNFFLRFFEIEDSPLSGGPDTIENILFNNRFSAISSTSFQSFMNNETFTFKMNTGYSTSVLSDFYYGSNIIDNFETLDIKAQIYKTTISNKEQ